MSSTAHAWKQGGETNKETIEQILIFNLIAANQPHSTVNRSCILKKEHKKE